MLLELVAAAKTWATFLVSCPKSHIMTVKAIFGNQPLKKQVEEKVSTPKQTTPSVLFNESSKITKVEKVTDPNCVPFPLFQRVLRVRLRHYPGRTPSGYFQGRQQDPNAGSRFSQ